ncbi:MAG: ATP-binding protein [Methylococcaceae bacterium]
MDSYKYKEFTIIKAQQKILIVDDVPANLMALQVSLSKVDAEIITATSGNDALALVLQHKISLILLDVQMPGMDGFEVAQHLQDEHSTADIPIIFVTAFSRDEKNIYQGYQSGAVDYLYKPIDTTILLSKVNIFLKLDKITRQLQANEKQLKQTVKNRTQELAVALKKAESANEAKTEFLANMTHEMRTPLHGILSFANLALKVINTINNAKLEKYIDRIELSGRRLLGLVDNLLDLSKLEAGKMELTRRPNDMKQLIESCVSELEANFKDNQLAVIWEITDCTKIVNCDGDSIKQVISNLLSNAIKFSEQGHSIFIAIKGQSLDSTDTNVQPGILCSVRDQGIGIPENELESVFDKFSQSSKTKTNAGGTGLGLAISHEIIKLHQGKIWAEQNVDKGSIFKFFIPYSVDN